MGLIDGDKLLQKIEKAHCKTCDDYNHIRCRACIINDAKMYIKEAESARSIDATPTYWVKETDRTNHWHCPKCGYTVGLANMWDNYCPKCGIRIARKEGEKIDF